MAALTFCALLACSLTESINNAVLPATDSAVPYGTLAPIVTATAPPGGSTMLAAATCSDSSSVRGSQYHIEATVDVDQRSADVHMRAVYHNSTGKSLQQIVFNVEANRKANAFALNDLTTDSSQVMSSYLLNGARLEANLKSPLAPSCDVAFTMVFTVKPPPIEQTFTNNFGFFGFSDRQFNLGLWLPEFAPYLYGAFYTPHQWLLGEYVVEDLSNFEAIVNLRGKDSKQLERYSVIGPGETSRDSAGWHFKINGARTFTLSVSADQEHLTTKTADGITVDIYYFRPPAASTATAISAAQTATNSPTRTPQNTSTAPTPVLTPTATIPTAAQFALDTAKSALERFSKVYGTFPYNRVAIVEGDFPDGMEFSGMVFISEKWFAMYTGNNDSWLTILTAHEVAHQWWYSLVGDDQGNTPMLDEALACYSELIYVETAYPTLINWWWSFRVNAYNPEGYPDSRIYDFQNLRQYINAVYLRGAMMLRDIRKTLGDDAFFQWLRDFRAAEAGKIATFTDFWGALSPADYTKITAIRARYLRYPDPLHPELQSTKSATAGK